MQCCHSHKNQTFISSSVPPNFGGWHFKDTCNQPLVTNLCTIEKHNTLASSWTRLSLLRKKQLTQHLPRAQIHLASGKTHHFSKQNSTSSSSLSFKNKSWSEVTLERMIITIFSMRLSFSPVKNDNNYFCCFYKNSRQALECLKRSLFCCCTLNIPVLPSIFYMTRHIYVWWDKCPQVRLGSPIHYPAFE